MDYASIFDEWRREYDRMTFSQQKSFYDGMYDYFPLQQNFNLEEILNFFDLVSVNIQHMKIFELGGWNGELVAKIIPIYDERIACWHNYEICEKAIRDGVCFDIRYRGIVTEDFVWKSDFHIWGYNMAIFSHVLEHMREMEIQELFKKLIHVSYIYIDLPPLQKSWTGYIGTHILEKYPEEILTSNEFKPVYSKDGIYFLEREESF